MSVAVQPIKEKSTMPYKVAIIVLIIIIIALVSLPMTGMVTGAGDSKKAQDNTKALYEVITGTNVEILKTQEEHGLYRVTARVKDTTGQDTVQDVFVTKDGLFFTDSLVDLELQKSTLTNQSAFVQCLAKKNVAIIGLSTDQGTQVQLQALGAFSPKIYIDCSGQYLALCQQWNITRVPMIFVNGQMIPGPQGVQWFEQNIGCYMTESGTKV